jgi:site-specific recombinase XerD
MRNFLISTKSNKEILEGKKEVFILMKNEKKRILYYIERTIHFIEKYLNKKTELLKKTVLNEDVIREIISFL